MRVLFISVCTILQMFGLEMDGGVSDGGWGYKLSETTLQQGGLWYMVHKYIHVCILVSMYHCIQVSLYQCIDVSWYTHGYIYAWIHGDTVIQLYNNPWVQ